MTVRRKTLLIIGITCLGLVIVLYTASRSFLLGGFIKLEQASARENTQRVLNALDQDFGVMDRFTFDRASIDDTYNAMLNPSMESLKGILGKDASGTNQTRRFNFIVLIDSSGRVIAFRGLNLATKQLIGIPQSLKSHFSLTDPIFQTAGSKGKTTGVLLLPEGPLLLAARPIVSPTTKGPPRGLMLSARYLVAGGVLESLERVTKFSLSVKRLGGEDLPPDVADARLHLSSAGDIYVRSIGESNLGGYSLLHDVYGNPALILKAEMPRLIYRQGQVSQLYFVGSLGIAGLVFAVAVMLLLEKSVVSRLSALNTSVASIASSGDASARVRCPGTDELSHLGVVINQMLESLQLSQRQNQQTEERYRAFMNNIPAIAMKPVRQSELYEVISRILGAPKGEGAQPLITRHSLASAGVAKGALRVLIAEDNLVNQQLAARLLEKRGHDVKVVSNGREALAALDQRTYDLVLMDVQMPEMDGFEATKRIRAAEKQTGLHLPVIALTAHAMKGDRERCLQAGMDGYLSKPIRALDLHEILERYLPPQAAPEPTPESAGKMK